MTSETQGPRRVGRSIAAVLAGLLIILVLSITTDVALHAAGVFPPLNQPQMFTTPLLIVATVYRSIYAVAGSYVAARLAPGRPMQHALALGIVGLALSIAGAIGMRNAGHAWYPLALVALALPCAWAGGRVARGHEVRS
jgi:hypothetical protein